MKPSTLEDFNITRDYYEAALDQVPFYSKLLPKITMPRKNIREIILTTIIVFSLLGWILSSTIYFFCIGLAIGLLIKIKNDLREKVLNNCLQEEWILARSLAEDDGDPYFPEDPKHVVSSDREYIFRCTSKRIKVSFCKTPWRIIIKKNLDFIRWLLIVYLFLFTCYFLTNMEPLFWFLPTNIFKEK
jgi:hypothetical protein